MIEEDEENVVDKIIKEAGEKGPFQIRFVILFNVIFVMLGTLAYICFYISLYVPDHWCKVSGEEKSKINITQWKSLTIPRQDRDTNQSYFERCLMYDDPKTKNVIPCQNGWEYDYTWFSETIISQENWVCDRSIYATNALAASSVGDILGTFIFGQLGDIIGRKPVFILILLVLFTGRVITIFSSSVYPVFLASIAFGNLSSMVLFQTTLIVIIEISRPEARTLLNLIQFGAWTVGVCVAPWIFYAVRHYRIGMMICTFPLGAVIFFYGYMIESPRWLAQKGKIEKCVRVLKKIAKCNNRTLQDSTITSLYDKNKHKTETSMYGIFSLYSSRRLFRLSVLDSIGWSAFMLTFIICLLNLNNLSGNPFVAYFFQGISEFVGQTTGRFLGDKFGRRITRFFGFFGVVVTAAVLAYVVTLYEMGTFIIILSFILKYHLTISRCMINLQSLELFPTCLRQTGISVSVTIGYVFSLFGPYIVYLGTKYNKSLPYFAIILVSTLGMILGLFLPETLNEKLPETIEDAENFGKNQKFWSLPRKYAV